MNRFNIARILSLIASAMACIGFYNAACIPDGNPGFSLMMGFGILIGLASYCFCGLLGAIKTPFSLAKWGFFIAPFPINLGVVVSLFFVGIVSVILFPAYPVFKSAARQSA